MNKVYFPGGKTPITPVQMANAANAITRRDCFTPYDFMGDDSRISYVFGKRSCTDVDEGVITIKDGEVIKVPNNFWLPF